MSPYLRIGLAVVWATLIAAGWQWRQRHARSEEGMHLREENSRLRREARQRIEARRSAWPAGGAEVAPPTASVAPAVDRETSVAATPSSGAPAAGTAAGGRGHSGNYQNAGQATPHAALQTLAWACDQGDAELMQKLLVFDEIARKKTEAYFASLPPAARPPGSLDALAAALYVSDGIQHPYPVAEVLARARFEPVNPARMILRLPGANGDGYEFQQTPGGWKLVVTEAVIDGYIRRSAKDATKP